jgi:hypothetical protein
MIRHHDSYAIVGRRASTSRAAIQTPHDRVGDRPHTSTRSDENRHYGLVPVPGDIWQGRANGPGGVADNCCVRQDIARHYRTGPDHRSVTDRDRSKSDRVRPKGDVVPDRHRGCGIIGDICGKRYMMLNLHSLSKIDTWVNDHAHCMMMQSGIGRKDDLRWEYRLKADGDGISEGARRGSVSSDKKQVRQPLGVKWQIGHVEAPLTPRRRAIPTRSTHYH